VVWIIDCVSLVLGRNLCDCVENGCVVGLGGPYTYGYGGAGRGLTRAIGRLEGERPSHHTRMVEAPK